MTRTSRISKLLTDLTARDRMILKAFVSRVKNISTARTITTREAMRIVGAELHLARRKDYKGEKECSGCGDCDCGNMEAGGL